MKWFSAVRLFVTAAWFSLKTYSLSNFFHAFRFSEFLYISIVEHKVILSKSLNIAKSSRSAWDEAGWNSW